MPRPPGVGMREPDRGFTLIELLVVIVIIGILAAIAIPIFMKQRATAADAAAKSDLRNLAQFEESYLADAGQYGPISAVIAAGNGVRVSPQVTLNVVLYDAGFGYCLSATHAGSPTTWYWDSQSGGLQPKTASGCPITVTGTPGDSLP